MDQTLLHWVSPSWPSLMGMELLEKGRQLPWISQPLCILPYRGSYTQGMGFAEGREK